MSRRSTSFRPGQSGGACWHHHSVAYREQDLENLRDVRWLRRLAENERPGPPFRKCAQQPPADEPISPIDELTNILGEQGVETGRCYRRFAERRDRRRPSKRRP